MHVPWLRSKSLARESTHSSHVGHAPLFPVQAGTILDPNSDKPDAREWEKAYYQPRLEAPGHVSPRKSVFAFRHMDVYGSISCCTTCTDHLLGLCCPARSYAGPAWLVALYQPYLLRSGERLCTNLRVDNSHVRTYSIMAFLRRNMSWERACNSIMSVAGQEVMWSKRLRLPRPTVH